MASLGKVHSLLAGGGDWGGGLFGNLGRVLSEHKNRSNQKRRQRQI